MEGVCHIYVYEKLKTTCLDKFLAYVRVYMWNWNLRDRNIDPPIIAAKSDEGVYRLGGVKFVIHATGAMTREDAIGELKTFGSVS